MNRYASVVCVLLAGMPAVILLTGCGKQDESVTGSGIFEALEVIVSPEIGGRIVELPVTEGHRIAREDLVAVLDVDILEKDDELIVLADMPGAQGDKIDVEFDDGQLTIHAEVEARQDPNTQYLLNEFEVGNYFRTFHDSAAIEIPILRAGLR